MSTLNVLFNREVYYILSFLNFRLYKIQLLRVLCVAIWVRMTLSAK